MTRSIGGTLNWGRLYGRDAYRPLDAPTLRAAAVEMARQGLLPRDIAAALELTEAAVRQLLSWEGA